jgi:hypothetical protein
MRHYALTWKIFIDENVVGPAMQAVGENVILGS